MGHCRGVFLADIRNIHGQFWINQNQIYSSNVFELQIKTSNLYNLINIEDSVVSMFEIRVYQLQLKEDSL